MTKPTAQRWAAGRLRGLRSPRPATGADDGKAKTDGVRHARKVAIALRYSADKRDKRRRAGLTGIRIAELRRVFHDRHGLELPDSAIGRDCCFIMANHLAHRIGDASHRIAMWLELAAPWMSGTQATTLIADVLDRPLRWRADKLGARLGLTEAERQRLGITTIGSIDVPKAERAKRRRIRDRIRRQQELRKQGAKPRAAYEAASLARSKPWEALGMSRTAWYRAGKPTRGTSASAA